MTTYRPSRVPHAILSCLAPGPAFLADLADAIPTAWPRHKLARKIHLTLGALIRDGFVRTGPDGYWITREGREALADLDDGITVTTGEVVGSVRVFGAAA
jgi:hypothetical protein